MAAPGQSQAILRSMLRHSYFVGLLTAACAPLAAIWRALGRTHPRFARRVAPPDGSSRLDELASRSTVVQGVGRGAATLGCAWATAASVDRLRRMRAQLRALPLPAVIRLAGVVWLAALATHIVAVALMPARLRPAMPLSVAAVAFVGALLMVGANHAIARAWGTWTRR